MVVPVLNMVCSFSVRANRVRLVEQTIRRAAQEPLKNRSSDQAGRRF